MCMLRKDLSCYLSLLIDLKDLHKQKVKAQSCKLPAKISKAPNAHTELPNKG